MSATFYSPEQTARSPKAPVTSVTLRGLCTLLAVYVAGPSLGLAMLIGLFQSGLLAQVPVYFYRGLVLISLAFLGTFASLFVAVRRSGPDSSVRRRDAFSAAMLSLAVNLCFFVLFPVTVDRSISVFMLGEMAAHEGRAYSSDEMSQVFADVYVGDYRQIDRRMREQLLSGNVVRAGDSYRISRRGLAFIQSSKLIARLFGSDTRFVSPPLEPRPHLRASMGLGSS